MNNRSLFVLALVALVVHGPAMGQEDPRPTAETAQVMSIDSIDRLDIEPPDMSKVATEDSARAQRDQPPRFAIENEVAESPQISGTWEDLEDGNILWRLRITARGAKSINLGFTRFHMPKGGRLFIYSADGSKRIRPFTGGDNKPHGQLWTPVVNADDIIIEVTIPEARLGELELELGSVNYGYRGFGSSNRDKSGACNIDVVCPEGDAWADPISSVAVYSLGGSTFCTGFLVNNTAQDLTPYFMTADHCNVTALNAPSLVTYWNYENSTCRVAGSPASGGPGDGTLDQFVTGSTLRAGHKPSDMTLVELDTAPTTFDPFYAGWDNGPLDAASAVAIHHPDTDEKRISFEDGPTSTTSYFGSVSPGDGTHVRVLDWDLGTTEPGSSGSPLFDQNARVVGQLHGGSAACGNDLPDWYGRLSVSWTGGGTDATRLSNWLDPLASGVTAIDGIGGGTLQNDDFADRAPIAGVFGRTSGSNEGATGETGEPDHAGSSLPLNSIWFEWVAPFSGVVSFDTLGSNFDTTLAVYTGNGVGTLTEIASNDDEPGGTLQSEVTFTANSGASYKIAVDGFEGAAGSIALNWGDSNDDFSGRVQLTGASGQTGGSNAGATGETGEPNHAGASEPLNSIWFEWVAPLTGQATIDTTGSDFDTTLAVYTGDGVGALTPIASNDDQPGGALQSEVTFTAVSGVSYKIAVDGFADIVGNAILHWNLTGAAACFIEVGVDYAAGALDIEFVLATTEPSVWSTYLLLGTGGRLIPLWQQVPLPPVDFAFPLQIPLPDIGVVGVVSVLSTGTEPFCAIDWDAADTGGAGAAPVLPQP